MLWKGPQKDGITYSMLTKFLVCRERFRLLVSYGVRPIRKWDKSIGYGQMWHAAEEAMTKAGIEKGKTQSPLDAMKEEYNRTVEQYQPDAQDITYWYSLCKTQWQAYVKCHEDSRYNLKEPGKPLLAESVFDFDYQLPSGRSVRIRGKFDAVWRRTTNRKSLLWVRENKTKGYIDKDMIGATICQNLQTMLYLVALEHTQKIPVGGISYNVIRRPLSDKYSPRQKKSETLGDFIIRAASTPCLEDPSNWFMRFTVPVKPIDIEQFKIAVLNPILESLCLWYESDPDENQYNNPHHWQSPWGVFNPLFSGGHGDYYDYLTTGRETELEQIDNLYPEL